MPIDGGFTTGPLRSLSLLWTGLLAVLLLLVMVAPAHAEQASAVRVAWWVWPSALFVVTFLLGTVAVLAGVGGGVVFVPIVSGFLPFHLDFVRAAGLFVALSGALSASPGLLKARLADIRLALPLALIASASAIIGAVIGLALPTAIVQTLLGVIVLGVVVVVLLARRSDFPQVAAGDALSSALAINGVYYEASLGSEVEWKIHRTGLGFLLFVLIGLAAGMFGLGAGWANVPVLNLVMGAPLKVAVGTSMLLLSITDTSAAWVYLNEGAVLPMLVIPSMLGMMVGSRVGVRVLAKAKPGTARWILIAVLLFAGIRALLEGLGTWQ